MAIAGWAAAILVICAILQAFYVRRDRRRFPPPGRLVNGRHVRQTGGSGPVVVFEAGIAASSSNWWPVQAMLAASTRTVSYDRPGLGWSTPSRGRWTLRTLTDELHALIHALDLPRPLVLAGHSFGTYIVRVYTHRFPEDVAGLVLVDPVTPEEWANPGWRDRVRLRRAMFFAYLASVLALFGLVRVGLWGLLRRGGGNAGPVLGLSRDMRRIASEGEASAGSVAGASGALERTTILHDARRVCPGHARVRRGSRTAADSARGPGDRALGCAPAEIRARGPPGNGDAPSDRRGKRSLDPSRSAGAGCGGHRRDGGAVESRTPGLTCGLFPAVCEESAVRALRPLL